MAAMLRDSVAVAVTVVRTRPRAILLAMITMRKSTHEFPFVLHMRPPELRYKKRWAFGHKNEVGRHLAL